MPGVASLENVELLHGECWCAGADEGPVRQRGDQAKIWLGLHQLQTCAQDNVFVYPFSTYLQYSIYLAVAEPELEPGVAGII